jgi:hypothetical protein
MNDREMPLSRRLLDIAIEKMADRFGEAQRVRRALANTIVAQLMSDCVIKGGSSLKFRYGDLATRVTKDMDVAQAKDLDDFILRLDASLRSGWHGFTGHIIRRPVATPKDVPPEYVMHPFDVKLEYNRKPWMTVRLEMGTDEVDDTEEADYSLSSDIVELFHALGLPKPNPVPLMKLHHQIAQKLHGLTDPSQNRPHDLVDLQLILSQSKVDLTLLRKTAIRLFAHRKRQHWPAIVHKGDDWEIGYNATKYDLPVLPTVDEAVEWANDLIAKIDASK